MSIRFFLEPQSFGTLFLFHCREPQSFGTLFFFHCWEPQSFQTLFFFHCRANFSIKALVDCLNVWDLFCKQYRSQGLSGWATRPPGGQKCWRKWEKCQNKKTNEQTLRKEWGKWKSCPSGTVRLATAMSVNAFFIVEGAWARLTQIVSSNL